MNQIKDMILHLLNKKNSEDFFGILAQPENACPHAENFLKKIQIRENELLILKNKLIEIPTMQLSNKILYNYYVAQIDEAIDLISEQITKLDLIIDEVESWRNRCLSARVMFSDLKKDFWFRMDSINKDKWPNWSQIIPYEIDRNVFFELEAIEFHKFESNCSFFHENFGFLDQDFLIIDLTQLKEIYLNIYSWGNQLIVQINNIMLQNKCLVWNLFWTDHSCDPKDIDPSKEYICFTNEQDAINFILKNGSPSFIFFNANLEIPPSSGFNLAKFLIDYDNQCSCLPKQFAYQFSSNNSICNKQIIDLLSNYLYSKKL